MDLSVPHVASLPARTRRCLAQARRLRGLPRLYALALASQMLREQLDAVDQRLQRLLQDAARCDRAIPDAAPGTAPDDPATALAAIADSADLARALGAGGGELPA